MMPNISGMYLSQIVAGLTVLMVTLIVSWRLWTQRVKLPLRQPDWRKAYAVYRRSLNLIFHGNLL
ncbi:MAG: hypothetical protein KJ760_19945, partial [Proteobacteria bacterium]|nr:hypothetical protein [Pseudomonadota bacterium]